MKFALSVIMVSLMVFAVCADEENQESSAATCYVCNSNEDSSCDDGYTGLNTPTQGYSGLDKHKQACENGETFCRKIIQKVKDVTSIVRQCAKELREENFEGCYSTAGKSTQFVCTCNAKAGPCNTGVAAKSSFGAMILSIVIAKLFL